MPRYQDTCQLTLYNAQIVDFPTPGSCSWTVPTGVCCLTFEIWGAGGGGGARCCCGCYRAGVGGSGGGYSKKTISTTPGTVYSICVGAGGMQPTVGSCTGHYCCFGGDGQTTYVTGTGLSSFCATGGCGGNTMCSYQCGCVNVGVGCGYNGDINKCGSTGIVGTWSDAQPYTFSRPGTAPWTSNETMSTIEYCCQLYCRCFTSTFPGGGGSSPPGNYCCCCQWATVGANGLVRIRY